MLNKKKRMKDVCALILLLLALSADLFAQSSQQDPVSVIDTTCNYLQFEDRLQAQRLRELLDSARFRKIRLAHFGDSHVQMDQFSGMLRNLLQQQFGNAGRGMIFPYTMAKTYSQSDYKSDFTGSWSTANSIQPVPRIPLGVSGFVAETSDPAAGFRILFSRGSVKGRGKVYLYCHADSGAYEVEFKCEGSVPQRLPVKANPRRGTPLEFSVPEFSDTLSVKFFRSSGSGKLSFYGLSLEGDKPGILYHNLGVGGAAFLAVLKQVHFEGQFASIRPDIVLLDWGTNDILYTNSMASDLPGIIRKTIQKVRAVCPQAVILLPGVQDMNFRARNISAGLAFSDTLRSIARSHRCLYYDWYCVSGGKKSMKTWVSLGLGRPDQVHLTKKGYQLKGELLYRAILRNSEVLNNQELKSFFLTREEKVSEEIPKEEPSEALPSESVRESQQKNEKPVKREKERKKEPAAKSSTAFYVVKKGDTPGGIAQKTGCGLAKLRKLNGLNSDVIHPGQKLRIK